jgi:nucleotide-binding universal stress UspA family protein
MKKFLAVFDGYKMSQSTMDYAIWLTKASDAHLVGIFLDEFIYRSYSVYNVVTSGEDTEELMKELDGKDKTKRDEAVQQFKNICRKAGVNFSVHRDKSIAIQELKHESMFADLVIINEYETFTKQTEDSPTDFIKDLLGDVQCPVLVVPKEFKPIDKIVLLYDGRPSSLYAIKMFSYIFGALLELPVEVYTVKDHYMGSPRVPDNKLMKEFIERHFTAASYTVTKGNAKEQITNYLRAYEENQLVVLGAYLRSEMSRLFKTSMADILMKELDTPLFIAHK